MKNRICALALIACMLLAFTSCKGSSPDPKTNPEGGSTSESFKDAGNVVSFSYSFGSGFSAEPVKRYVVRDLFGKTVLEYYEYDNCMNGFPLEVDASIYGDLLSIIEDNDIYSWDGFDKSADVTDGYGFSLQIAFDNAKLAAHGYMMEPDNYDIGHSAIETYFDIIIEAQQTRYSDSINSIVGTTVSLPKMSDEDKAVFNEQPDDPVASGWHSEVWPHNYDLSLAIEKGLASEDGFSDEYFEIQALYRCVLENYISATLNLELYETMISVTNIVPQKEDMQNIYRRYSTMHSQYFYLRNNIYIERLDQADLDMLAAAIKDGEAYIFRDIVYLVQRTFRDTICPYEDGSEDTAIYSVSPLDEDADNYDVVIGLDGMFAFVEPIEPVDWTTEEVLDYMETVFEHHRFDAVTLFREAF